MVRIDFNDQPFFWLQLLLKENGELDLSDEAQALGVFLFSGDQSCFGGDFTYFRFLEVTNGEKRPRQLLLRELAEEVALVFVRIRASDQTINRPPVGTDNFVFLAVMPCGNVIGPKAQGGLQEQIKLDFTVAKHVRIRSSSGLVLLEHVINDAFFVVD